ncbi:MAG: hypothetical protein QXM31_01970 [Candidatus Woesearchaeota archaeon]
MFKGKLGQVPPIPTSTRIIAILLVFFGLVMHVLDLGVLRRGSLVSIQAFAIPLIIYTCLAIVARIELRDNTMAPFYWFGASWLVPIVLGLLAKYAIVPQTVLSNITIAAAFFPLFIFYFYSRGVLTWPITIYLVLWLIGILIWFGPGVWQYAKDQNIDFGFNPALSYEYLMDWSIKTWKNLVIKTKELGTMAKTELEITTAMLSGDYYTGQVDNAAKKRLGVYLENFRTSEPAFYENTPVIAYATIKAETLDRELPIRVSCEADDGKSVFAADDIRPNDFFSVITADQFDIDCIWNPPKLKKGTYSLKLRTEFDFSTRAYARAYFMDRDRLREYRVQNIDPLKNIPDKSPVAVYTSGPVRIGIETGQQPIALGNAGEALPSMGVTVTNIWEGKVLEMTGIFFIIPKGLKIPTMQGIKYSTVECSALPAEEQPACDDTLVNIYSLSSEELALPYYKNLTTKTFRLPLEITDPQKVLGKAPLGVQNFKVSVQYRYMNERTMAALVKEAAG